MDVGFDSICLILFGLATLAGWIDSIAGGGGLITIPALMWAGLSPAQSLATNKLQASFGSSTATLNYARHGLVDIKGQRFAVLMAFIGSACGTLSVQHIPATYLQKALPLLLIAFAIYFLFAPNLSDSDRQQRITPPQFALSAGFAIGFYDGFFGPGTGAFFTMAYVELLSFGLPRAIGNTKLLNFTSNFASLLFFALSGQIIWLLGLLMGLGQILGSYLGSRMAIRHGSKLIRPLLVGISLLMSIKLLWNFY
jgi:hypothetical protein